MTVAFLDVCRFLPVSTGIGDFVVASASPGYQTPAAAGVTNGATYRYRAETADLSLWEVGYGVYTTATATLARTNVLYNSLGTTAKINFTSRPNIGIVLLQADVVSPDNLVTLSNKTIDTDSNTVKINGVAVTANTGTGAVVRQVSPALTTPNLGVPSAGDLSNCTIPASQVLFTQTGTGAVARTGQNKLQEIRTFEDFGAVGNGTTDDRAALQAGIDAMSAAGGGIISGTPGKFYRAVINSGVTDIGLILKPNVLVLLNKSQISLDCTGSVYGIRMQSNSHIWGPGAVKTTASSSPGTQSIWHAPVCLGTAVGEVTSTGALGNYLNATRWSIRSLTIDSVRSGGYGIAGVGGISHGVIDFIDYPSSSSMIGGINFDWGTVGAITSSDIPTSRTNFNAGTAYTVHPNNITITNLKFGSWTNALSTPIRLSAVHAIRVENFEIEQCRTVGFFHTAGDCGYEFAPSNVKRDRHRGIVIRNGAILAVNAVAGVGYQIDGLADNVNAAVGSGYVPLLSPINACDMVLENLRTVGAGADGFYFRYIEGVTLRNGSAALHNYGVRVGESCKRLKILGGEYHDNVNEGVYVGNVANPSDIIIDGAYCYSNGTGGTFGGIALANGARHVVQNCVLGITAEGFQDYGIDLQSCTDATVVGNQVVATAASGTAYKLGASTTSYGVLKKFENNSASSATTYTSGVNIVPYEYYIDASNNVITMNRALKAALTSSKTPTTGTWKAGTMIFYQDPSASSFIGTFCTTSGSPGTWTTFGPTSA